MIIIVEIKVKNMFREKNRLPKENSVSRHDKMVSYICKLLFDKNIENPMKLL